MILTAADLFTPAASGVGPFGVVPGQPASGTWLSVQLGIAAKVGLPTTSWQPGAPERTILAIESVCFSQSDVNISVMAQGGFLQTAASGTVTYTALDGTQVTIPVTPDPSNAAQNTTGALGWLDLLTVNVYDVERLAATAATGPLAIANLSGVTVGPYAAGQYHVANTTNGSTYSNPASLTIPSSAIAGTGGVVTAVAPGFNFTIVTTQSAHGLIPGQTVYLAIPTSTGISGLSNVFAIVVAVTSNTFQIGVGSSGTWAAGGTVYLATVATMQADVAGIASNAAPGSVTINVTQNAGVFVGNVVGWSGANWESNTALATRSTLSLAARSPNGPSQAYVYFAETAVQLLEEATPPYILTNGPVQAFEFANPQTGIVTTVVASSSPVTTSLGLPVTPGCAQNPVASMTNANPCVVSLARAHGLTTGMSATISGSITPASLDALVVGTFVVTVTSATAFSIPIDTTSAGTYTGGGSVEGGDLGAIDQLLQDNVVPDGITAVTTSALALPISISATVIVPQAYVAAYRLAVVRQLQTQISNYSIGGNSPAFAVTYDDIVGALEEAGVLALGQASYVRQVQSLSINGLGIGVGVPFPSNEYQAILTVPSVTVIGV